MGNGKPCLCIAFQCCSSHQQSDPLVEALPHAMVGVSHCRLDPIENVYLYTMTQPSPHCAVTSSHLRGCLLTILQRLPYVPPCVCWSLFMAVGLFACACCSTTS